MEQNPITTQPLRASVIPLDIPAEVPTAPAEVLCNDNILKERENGDLKEHLTEVTAVFDPHAEITEEDKKKRRQQHEEVSDCCCVYTNDDAFCLYILCHCICDCFRGIGHCTEDCFEGCANCLSGCCEGDGCVEACCSCDSGDVTSATDANCLGGCLDCCTSCDCDCSS